MGSPARPRLTPQCSSLKGFNINSLRAIVRPSRTALLAAGLALVGLGGVLAVTSVWGMLESFTHIVHFQPTWTFTLFWCFVDISTPFLQRRYR